MITTPFFANPAPAFSNRRQFLQRAGNGFGSLALAGLLAQEGRLANAATGHGINPLAPRQGHFAGKAKSVIWLFMNGGPSQVDTWDYKPELEKRDGKELAGFDQTTGFFAGQGGPLMKSPFKFAQHGECGAIDATAPGGSGIAGADRSKQSAPAESAEETRLGFGLDFKSEDGAGDRWICR